MSDLLKEAIADAKTVRETAIANAKMALEEAFTPHLKSMLSAKLAEEDDEEDAEEMRGDKMEGEHEDEEEGMRDNDEMRGDNDEDHMRGHEEGEHEDEEDAEEMREEDIIEIDGVKYAPIVAEEEDDEEDNEEGMREDAELDLESVIKELETEIAESENSDDDLTEGEHEDDEDKVDEEIVVEEDEDDDEDKVDEQSTSSGIGAGDNKVKQPSAGDEEDPGKGKDKPSSKNESVELKAELKEYKEAVSFLREKLHEVNILNAKLLYTNRLFKEFVLSNDQKMKIVETFDRAQTTREIKLVYSTLAESFKNGDVKKSRVQESASKKRGTTKPTQKIITEESQVADRFKKLAGIL